jgi:hypothetical protein
LFDMLPRAKVKSCRRITFRHSLDEPAAGSGQATAMVAALQERKPRI